MATKRTVSPIPSVTVAGVSVTLHTGLDPHGDGNSDGVALTGCRSHSSSVSVLRASPRNLTSRGWIMLVGC